MHRTRSEGQRRPVLGLFTDWLKDPYQNAVVTAVARACAEQDVNLLCFAGGCLDNDQSGWSRRNILYEFAGPHNIDALIVMGGNVGTRVGPVFLKQYLERCRVPKIVSIAYRLGETPSVLVDNQVGLRRVIEHLIVVHRRQHIAFLRGPAENPEAEERFAVYRNVLWERGIEFEPRLTAIGDFLRPTGVTGMREILAAKVPLDAVVGANDLMALGALDVLQDAGLRIPEDVSLVGFDDVDDARVSLPQMTTVRQPFHLLGREAVRVALAALHGDAVPIEVTVPTQVVIRRSCGCGANVAEETEQHVVSVAPTASPEELRRRFIGNFAALEADGIVVKETTALELFDEVCDELSAVPTGRFAARLADLIRTTAADSLNPWNRLTKVIFQLLDAWTSLDAERRRRADIIAQQVRGAVGDVAELTQGMMRVRLQRLTLNLSDVSKALTGAVSFEGIREALDTYLPLLGIPTCFLSLYVDPSSPHRGAKLAWAFDKADASVSTRLGEEFPCRDLVPGGLMFQRGRESIMLEPLYFEDDQLGLLAAGLGPEEGVVYEAVRDQISGAIRGVMLVERMLEEVKRRQALEKSQADKEMRIAANIQTMILPSNQGVPGFDVGAIMIPATNVGGDYYDIHPTANGCWLGIGDVVGHGLRSGLIMLMVQSAVSGVIRSRDDLTPREVLCAVNSLLHDNVRMRLRQDEHMTLCLLRAYADGRLQFAGAHEDLLVYRGKSKRCEQLRTDGIWAGIVPDVSRHTTDREVLLEPGDILLLYTDGITEARDVQGRMFGLPRLLEAFEKLGHESPPRICQLIAEQVSAYMASQEDDMALLVARYEGA